MSTNPYYVSYMRSEKWKVKCQEYFVKKGRWCRGCLKKSGVIHLHHLSYDRIGNEPLDDLIALCVSCHREVHRRHRAEGRRKSIRTVTYEYVREETIKRLRRKSR